MVVLSALFAAGMAIGGYISIPIGPVPVVLYNLFIFLAALLLGSKWGLLSVAVYLLCGSLGFPVFSGGGAGLAHLLGPTGGFLLGFLPAVWIGGFISEKGEYSILKSTIALVISALVVYACGVPWLKFSTRITWGEAFLAGMAPFLVIDAIKIAAAVIVQKAINPVWRFFITGQRNDQNKESEPEIS